MTTVAATNPTSTTKQSANSTFVAESSVPLFASSSTSSLSSSPISSATESGRESTLETSSEARYDSYKIPSQLIGKSKYETLKGYLAGWYQEYAYNRNDIDHSFLVIGEGISNHLAFSPLSFEGASILRNHLVDALFCRKIVNKGSVDNETADQDFAFRLDSINILSGTEMERLNEWIGRIPEGEKKGQRIDGRGSQVNHLLRIYVFLNSLRAKDALLILNRTAKRLKEIESAHRALSDGSNAERKVAYKLLGENAKYDAKEHSKWTKALEYLQHDLQDANLLLFYLRNGASKPIADQFDTMAKDQLYRLDVWTEAWQQRQLSILMRYRYREEKQDKQLSLGKTVFNPQKKTLETTKVRFLGERAGEKWDNGEWLYEWQKARDDYNTFEAFSSSPSTIASSLSNGTELSTDTRKLDKSIEEFYESLKETKPEIWSLQYGSEKANPEANFNRLSWNYLSDRELDFHKHLFEPPARFEKMLSKLQIPFDRSLAKSNRDGPTNIDQFESDKYLIEGQVDELVHQIFTHVSSEPFVSQPEGLLDCANVGSTDKATATSIAPIQIHLSFKQVVLMKWIYNDVYLSKSRKNTLSLNDNQIRYLNNTFTQTNRFIPKFAEQPAIAELSKEQRPLSDVKIVDSSDQPPIVSAMPLADKHE